MDGVEADVAPIGRWKAVVGSSLATCGPSLRIKIGPAEFKIMIRGAPISLWGLGHDCEQRSAIHYHCQYITVAKDRHISSDTV